MDDETPGSGPFQNLRDPVRARLPANLVGMLLAVGSSLSFALLDGSLQALALGICWLLMVPTALVNGWATAFFIEHGLGLRRAVAELVAGTLIALSACALLSYRESGTAAVGLDFIGSLALYVSVFRGLSALVGLGLGRGAGYLGNRIQDIDDTGW